MWPKDNFSRLAAYSVLNCGLAYLSTLESQKCVQRATNHLDAKPMGSSVLRSNKTVFWGEGIAF